jgi:hypothetical protein
MGHLMILGKGNSKGWKQNEGSEFAKVEYCNNYYYDCKCGLLFWKKKNISCKWLKSKGLGENI